MDSQNTQKGFGAQQPATDISSHTSISYKWTQLCTQHKPTIQGARFMSCIEQEEQICRGGTADQLNQLYSLPVRNPKIHLLRERDWKRKGDSARGLYRHKVMELCHETKKKPVNDRAFCNPGRIDVHMRIAHQHGLHRVARSESACFERDQSFPVRCCRFGEDHHMAPVVAHGFPLDRSQCIVTGIRGIPVDSYHLHR